MEWKASKEKTAPFGIPSRFFSACLIHRYLLVLNPQFVHVNGRRERSQFQPLHFSLLYCLQHYTGATAITIITLLQLVRASSISISVLLLTILYCI